MSFEMKVFMESITSTIMKLKQQLADLQIKNQELEMKSAQSQSPANLEKLVENLNLVEAQNVIYLDKDKVVAINK